MGAVHAELQDVPPVGAVEHWENYDLAFVVTTRTLLRFRKGDRLRAANEVGYGVPDGVQVVPPASEAWLPAQDQRYVAACFREHKRDARKKHVVPLERRLGRGDRHREPR